MSIPDDVRKDLDLILSQAESYNWSTHVKAAQRIRAWLATHQEPMPQGPEPDWSTATRMPDGSWIWYETQRPEQEAQLLKQLILEWLQQDDGYDTWAWVHIRQWIDEEVYR